MHRNPNLCEGEALRNGATHLRRFLNEGLDLCEADDPWGRGRFVEAVRVSALTDAIDDADENPLTPEEKQANGCAAFRKALADDEPFDCKFEASDWSWQ